MMLSADNPAFRELYPHGAEVFDARGRRLRLVTACNPETGEVVMVDLRKAPFDRLLFRFRKPQHRWWNWVLYCHSVQRRHGFWPAPLRVVPMEEAK